MCSPLFLQPAHCGLLTLSLSLTWSKLQSTCLPSVYVAHSPQLFTNCIHCPLPPADAGCDDKHLRVWRCDHYEGTPGQAPRQGQEVAVLGGHAAVPMCVKWAPKRTLMASGCHALCVWVPGVMGPPAAAAPAAGGAAAAGGIL